MTKKIIIPDKEIVKLQKAIKNLHGCDSKWLESIPIKEMFKDQVVWEGIVEVFSIINHPTSQKCYAWFFDDNETGKRKYITVLHQDPVDSPKNAVRAFIANEYKNNQLGRMT